MGKFKKWFKPDANRIINSLYTDIVKALLGSFIFGIGWVATRVLGYDPFGLAARMDQGVLGIVIWLGISFTIFLAILATLSLSRWIRKPNPIQIETFVEDRKVIVCVKNQSSKLVTDLNVELKNIQRVLLDSKKINMTDSFDRSNRSFESGDVADISAPILSKRKRLVYVGLLNDVEFVFLTKKNMLIRDLSEWDSRSSTPSVSEWVFRAEIELAINAQIDGNPITDTGKTFNMWIEVHETQSWDDSSGTSKKLGASSNLLAGELQDESKKANQKTNYST